MARPRPVAASGGALWSAPPPLEVRGGGGKDSAERPEAPERTEGPQDPVGPKSPGIGSASLQSGVMAVSSTYLK